jgi:hypothetical protein
MGGIKWTKKTHFNWAGQSILASLKKRVAVGHLPRGLYFVRGSDQVPQLMLE